MRKKTIVLLGMMSKMPVAGNMWLVAQYILGFKRLGYEVYYVEAHGIRPAAKFLTAGDEYGIQSVCDFISNFMQRFDMSDHWVYHALYGDGRSHGLSDLRLKSLYGTADLLINLHGATTPLPEHTATGRLVYLETDPVQIELGVANNHQRTIEFLKAHNLFFTWGINYGHPDCAVPLPRDIQFYPTLPPVIVDLWASHESFGSDVFTTVGNWRQKYEHIRFNGSVYHWSKHHEFLKFIDLPRLSQQNFELALSSSSYDARDVQMLESHGWRVRDALEMSYEINNYRKYIQQSRGEFTVAKDQNVRLRSGWFSERSAQYLAAGRPVITQDTGFSNTLPTGNGLFPFSEMNDILSALGQIESDYKHHSDAAAAIARDIFNYDVVLTRLLADAGL